MLKFFSAVDIREFNTLRIGGVVACMARISSEVDVPNAIGKFRSRGLPWVVIGAGSNSIFNDGELKLSVIKNEIKGITYNKLSDSVSVTVGAGVLWDDLVSWAVGHGLSGIEAMSAIPGTVGAAPVQNIGAYGQELRDTFVSARAYDVKDNRIVTLSNEDCCFDYRDSVFKHGPKNRYIITGVTLKLSNRKPTVPNYPGVKEFLNRNNIANPGLAEIRRAIIEIRKTKLPDPSLLPNVGSYFKNVLVPPMEGQRLLMLYPQMPQFPSVEGVKIPAGWLIEAAGLKGEKLGDIQVYDNNALVLVNSGSGTFNELQDMEKLIIGTVYRKFGLMLEREPEILSARTNIDY